ncbi:MAG TPA: xylulokinase [Acidimicrobiia bacterium]
MPLVCGVDSSTQSTKVELRDAETGVPVASGRAPHPVTSPPRSEQWPAEWWSAYEAARAAAGHHDDVAAIAVAGQQHGLVVLDANDEVIRPAKLWNDVESAPDAARLVDTLPGGAAAWAQRCGSVPLASFTVSKLAWLRRAEPDGYARVARVLLPHDWMTWRLSGARVTDRGDASGTGYWSPHTSTWCAELLAQVDPDVEWRTKLPEIAGPLDEVGRNGHAVVAPGTGDNMAAALGVGLGPGDVALSIGTSGTVYAVSASPTADPSGAVAGFADATGAFLPLVCTLNATKVTDALARVLDLDHDTFDRLALDAEPGAAGVVLVPYFDGERTPNRPHARGLLAGLRGDVRREQLARAAFEGVVCGLLEGLDALLAACDPATVGSHDGRLVLVGGGARSRAYRQVVADLAGRPVTVPAAEEQVATGACVQAAAVLHRCPPAAVADAWGLRAGTIVEPTPGVDAAAIRTRYAEARA